MSRDTTKRDSTTKAAAAKAPKKKEAPKPKTPPKDTVAPDLTVELEDASGRTARMPLSTFGAVRMPIESYIYRRKGRDKTQFPTLAEPVMQTYVMPLARFTSAAAGFDVGSLRTIRLVFDRKRSGAITLDDIGITR
ncbi:hypothetical protein [Gemmatimonas sp.]|uniref:hypothetical protein n=1 Tax=Gemmatimonas sp. TaxID=1962908 RepID=UPI00333F7414